MRIVERFVGGVQSDEESERTESGHSAVERITLLDRQRGVSANPLGQSTILDHVDGRYDQIEREEHGQRARDRVGLHLLVRDGFIVGLR